MTNETRRYFIFGKPQPDIAESFRKLVNHTALYNLWKWWKTSGLAMSALGLTVRAKISFSAELRDSHFILKEKKENVTSS